MKPSSHLDNIRAELLDGETILATVAGTQTSTPTSTSGTVRGMLVLTDQRFIFAGNAWGAKESSSAPLKQVTSIDLHKNLMTAHIQVTLAGALQRYLVKYNDAEPFAAAAHKALYEIHA